MPSINFVYLGLLASNRTGSIEMMGRLSVLSLLPENLFSFYFSMSMKMDTLPLPYLPYFPALF